MRTRSRSPPRTRPVLAGLAAGARTLTSGFPSTTPASLVTLGTGALPGAHGVLGFTLRMPDGGVLNHIHWGDDPDPREWQPVPTAFETAAAAGVRVTVVTRPEFEGTGLTVAANRGGAFVGASDADAVAAQMLLALSGPVPALVYGYHPDLDRPGHEDGVDSPNWRSRRPRRRPAARHAWSSGLPPGRGAARHRRSRPAQHPARRALSTWPPTRRCRPG